MKKKLREGIALVVVILAVLILGGHFGKIYGQFAHDDLNIGALNANSSDYTVYGPLKQNAEKRKGLLISDINLLELYAGEMDQSYELRFRIAHLLSLQHDDYLKDTTVEVTDSEGNKVKSGALLVYTVGLSAERPPKGEGISGSYNWIEKNSVEVHYLLEKDFLEDYSGQELTVTICCTENADDPLNTKESYAHAVLKIQIPDA